MIALAAYPSRSSTRAPPRRALSQEHARDTPTQVLLMRYFNWSPQTFDAVYNAGNCDTWVLRKEPGTRSYALSPNDSSPPRMPWATRQVTHVHTLAVDDAPGNACTYVTSDHSSCSCTRVQGTRTNVQSIPHSPLPGAIGARGTELGSRRRLDHRGLPRAEPAQDVASR